MGLLSWYKNPWCWKYTFKMKNYILLMAFIFSFKHLIFWGLTRFIYLHHSHSGWSQYILLWFCNFCFLFLAFFSYQVIRLLILLYKAQPLTPEGWITWLWSLHDWMKRTKVQIHRSAWHHFHKCPFWFRRTLYATIFKMYLKIMSILVCCTWECSIVIRTAPHFSSTQ